MMYPTNPYTLPGISEFTPADVSPHLVYRPRRGLSGLGQAEPEKKKTLVGLPPLVVAAGTAVMGYVMRSGRLDVGAAPFALMGAGIGWAVDSVIKDQPILTGVAAFAASWYFYERTGIGTEGGLALGTVLGGDGGGSQAAVDAVARQVAGENRQSLAGLAPRVEGVTKSVNRLYAQSQAHRTAVRKVAGKVNMGDPYMGELAQPFG